MSLKKQLLDNVPVEIKDEAYFQALLDHIKYNNIETKEHLHNYLSQEIQLVETWIENNKNSGTRGIKTVRDKVIHLDVLKKCFNLSQEFL